MMHHRETQHEEHKESMMDKVKESVPGMGGHKHERQSSDSSNSSSDSESNRPTMHDQMPAHHETRGGVTHLGADPATWAPVEGRRTGDNLHNAQQAQTYPSGNVTPLGATTGAYTTESHDAKHTDHYEHSGPEHKPGMMEKAKDAMHGLTNKMHKK